MQLFTIIGDVTVKEDVQKIVDATVTFFGKLDILVSIYFYS